MTMTTLDAARYLCECPDCGRRIILETEPYKITVLIQGDPTATHTGGLGGVVIGAQVEEPGLEPFKAWAKEHGL
jgi:hypothetical protein